MKSRGFRFSIQAFSLLICGLCALLPAHGEVIRFGFELESVDKTNRAKFEVAIERWQEEMNSLGQTPAVEVVVFEKREDLVQALKLVNVEAAVIYSYSFLEVSKAVRFDVGCAMGRESGSNFRFILLGRKDGPVQSMDDLDGASLRVVTSRFGQLPLIWLESELVKHAMQVGPNVTYAESAFDAVIPAYFGQTDAALVTREAFEHNAQLNTQLVGNLKVLAESPPFPSRLVIFPLQTPSDLRKGIIERALNAKLQIKDLPFLPPLTEASHGFSQGDVDQLREILRSREELALKKSRNPRVNMAGEPLKPGE